MRLYIYDVSNSQGIDAKNNRETKLGVEGRETQI